MFSKRSRYPYFIAILTISTLILTQVLCGLGNGGEESPVNQPPTAEETSTEEQPPAGDISFTFVNASDVDICAIAAKVDTDEQWNENILEEILKPGDTYTMTDLEPMTVDLIARDCAEEIIDTAYDTVIEGPITWEITNFEVVTYEPPAPPPTSPGQTWLVMLYLDADDEIIEEYINFSLNEAELVGSSEQVQIVAQLDRFEGGFAGDGDWKTAKRFYVTQDTDLSAIGSEELADLGEVNMADPDTLTEFVIWSMENYPADKYVLILSDHGGGYTGGWSDQSAGGDSLTLIELDSALAQVQAETGLGAIRTDWLRSLPDEFIGSLYCYRPVCPLQCCPLKRFPGL